MQCCACSTFLIHRKDFVAVKCESVVSYESKKPSGQDAHLADKKLVVNDTTRARGISQARLFVLDFHLAVVSFIECKEKTLNI